MNRPLSVLLAAAIALAAPACGGTPTSASSEPSVLVSARDGTVKGVGLGSSHDEIERVFGPNLGGSGYRPVDAETFTGPESIPLPGGVYGGILRYRGFAFLISDDGVYSLMTTVPGARTERGVGVGDALEDVRGAYPDAACDEYDYGYSGYRWCQALVGENGVFFGGDPIASITILRPAPTCRPAGDPARPDKIVCRYRRRGLSNRRR